MATYVNNLRLKEIATGAESGTWGTSTNTNLELIADALGSGTEAITTNADTHTTTIADGAADEGRALFLKYTGTLDSACTITLAPNTINKLWFIENATSGSQNIIISQGSGANITIAPGKIAVVLTDGAGSGAAVLDALADLELSGTLSVAGAATITGASTLTGVTTHGGNVVSDTNSTDDLGATSTRWANLWVDAITMTGALGGGSAAFSSTLAVTGITTHGDNVVSDTDSTDDLGTTGVRWANLWVDAITMGGTLAGAVATFSSTVGITGVTTHGDSVVPVTDSTVDLGTTGVRWANLWVDAITMGGTLAGAVATFSSTVGITGVTTHGDDVVSDTDSTDDLGTTGVRWANLWVDAVTMTAGFVAASGNSYIGDTANSKQTLGLTINMGANDNEILSLKSSDIAHGITGQTETDTYGLFQKAHAAGGGLQVTGLTDSDGGPGFALALTGMLGEAADTTKATNAQGIVHIRSYIYDGSTNVIAPGTDQNLVVFGSASSARFIFDAEGSGHADVEWVTFDKHNDLQVLEDMEYLVAPGQVVRQFGDVIKHDRAFFEDEGLFHDIREVGDGRMRGMMNYTRMLMLHSGAIRQVGGRQMLLENCLRDLVAANPTLKGGTKALALLETN
mgnify:FL=1